MFVNLLQYQKYKGEINVLKKLSLLLLLCIFLAGCINIPFGNDSGIKLSKDGITVTDEEGKKHRIGLDEDNNQVSVTSTNEKGEEVEMEWGDDLELPASFPTDIPIPDNIRIFQASDLGESVTVGYEVSADFDDIRQLYEAFMKESTAITKQAKMEGQDGMNQHVQFQGQREDGSISIMINNIQQNEELIRVILVYAKDVTKS